MQRGEVLPRLGLGLTSPPLGPKKPQNIKENQGLMRFFGTHLGNLKKVKNVPMQRGARFPIFDVPMGGPTWPQ